MRADTAAAVAGRTLGGRTLFVSIPLLRVLETTEADAVLAHELAHLGGGDTRSSPALGPKLQQFDQYTSAMRGGGLRITAPSAIADSLVKISAYSSYRASVERELFAHDSEHVGQLGIAGFVAAGLFPYAASPEFASAMQTANVPHPYDHHPPLPERMRNVGHTVAEFDWGAVVARTPQATWADEIVTAPAIEERLWGDCERRFAQSHELSLAYRYEPASDEEHAVVLRHFPPLAFELRKGERIEVSHLGIAASAAKIGWDDVKGLAFQGGGFTAVLVVTHHDKGLIGARKTTLKLRGMGNNVEAFRNAVARYWQRHQIMRAQQRAAAAA